MPAVPVLEEKPAAAKTPKPTRAELDVKHKEAFASIAPEDLKKQQEEWLNGAFGEKKPKVEEKPADSPKPAAAEAPVVDPAVEAGKKKDETSPDPAEGEGKKDEAPAGGLIDDVESEKPSVPASVVIDDPDLKVEKPAAIVQDTNLVDEDLDDDDREQLEAAAWLAKNDDRFTGRKLDKELKTFWDKEESRAKKWEKDNDGLAYDPAAPEHAEFYQKNQPPISEKDLKRASRGMIEDRAVARVDAKTSKRMQELENERRVEKAAPIIKRRAKEAVAELVEQIVPGTLLAGSKVLTEAVYADLAKKEPVAVEILNEEAVVLRHQIEALESMVHLGTADFEKTEKAPDGRGFIPARDVAQAGIDLEAKILALPPEKRLDGTRKFAPRLAYNNKFTEIVNGAGTDEEKTTKIAQLDARYWTVQPQDVRDYLVKESSNRVKKHLSRIPKVDKKADKTDETPAATEANNGAARTGATASTAISTSSDNVDTSALNKKSKEETNDILRKTMWA